MSATLLSGFITGGTGYPGRELIPLLLVRAVEHPANGIRTVKVEEMRRA